jgi:hypothetical protein
LHVFVVLRSERCIGELMAEQREAGELATGIWPSVRARRPCGVRQGRAWLVGVWWLAP